MSSTQSSQTAGANQTQQKKTPLNLKTANAQQIANMNSNMNSKNDKAEELFKQEREKWSKLLSPLYTRMGTKSVRDIVSIQSDTMSIREQIQQSLSYHSNQLSKARVALRNATGDRFEFYYHGFGMKTNTSDKVKMVDRDLAEAERRNELLEVHIEFLRECRISCDQIGYAVKNLVEILKYLDT
jgi:uncharacterized protein YicC (UPF0701 family)